MSPLGYQDRRLPAPPAGQEKALPPRKYPAVHHDLVQHDFTAKLPNRLSHTACSDGVGHRGALYMPVVACVSPKTPLGNQRPPLVTCLGRRHADAEGARSLGSWARADRAWRLWKHTQQ